MNECPPVIEAAYALAASRQMCCRADITLLVDVVNGLVDRPLIVQLGAGSGTMALAVLGARDDTVLESFDCSADALVWEQRALDNVRGQLKNLQKRYIAHMQQSAAAGRSWPRLVVDLLIVDADHTYPGVLSDLRAWVRHCKLVFVHDYDGATAPRRYPGVRLACDEVWGDTAPIHKAGWSAVFRSPWRVEG